MKRLRHAFSIASILLGGTAIFIPDTIAPEGIPLGKMLMGFATALNGVSLYLLKEEEHEAQTPT